MRNVLSSLSLCAALALAGSASADVTSYCTGGVNSTGQSASITWSGPVNPFQGSLQVSGLPADSFGIFVYGMGGQQTPFGDGFQCTSQSFILARTSGSAAGTLSLDVLNEGEDEDVRWLTSGLLGGANFQYLYRDQQGGSFNGTDAIAVVFE